MTRAHVTYKFNMLYNLQNLEPYSNLWANNTNEKKRKDNARI